MGRCCGGRASTPLPLPPACRAVPKCVCLCDFVCVGESLSAENNNLSILHSSADLFQFQSEKERAKERAANWNSLALPLLQRQLRLAFQAHRSALPRFFPSYSALTLPSFPSARSRFCLAPSSNWNGLVGALAVLFSSFVYLTFCACFVFASLRVCECLCGNGCVSVNCCWCHRKVLKLVGRGAPGGGVLSYSDLVYFCNLQVDVYFSVRLFHLASIVFAFPSA